MRVHLLVPILVVFAVSIIEAGRVKYEDRFLNYGVYIIQNRRDQGVLSFFKNSSSVHPTLQTFNDDNPGQKWRIQESSLYTAFELRPTRDEDYILAYEERGIIKSVSSWGWGNNKLWYLQDAGLGFTNIKNKHNEVCLQSRGLGEIIEALPCSNKATQQWKVTTTIPTSISEGNSTSL